MIKSVQRRLKKCLYIQELNTFYLTHRKRKTSECWLEKDSWAGHDAACHGGKIPEIYCPKEFKEHVYNTFEARANNYTLPYTLQPQILSCKFWLHICSWSHHILFWGRFLTKEKQRKYHHSSLLSSFPQSLITLFWCRSKPSLPPWQKWTITVCCQSAWRQLIPKHILHNYPSQGKVHAV